MFRFYRVAMNKYPFMTQCVTSGALTALGDVISQVAIQRKDLRDFDSRECARYFFVGSVFIAPVLRTWYVVLDKLVVRPTSMFAVKKVLLDQGVFVPPFLASLLGTLRILDGSDWQTVKDSVARDYKKILLKNWSIWPFVQFANFSFVPLNYQVILVNAVSVAWNTYIAYVAEQKTVVPNKNE